MRIIGIITVCIIVILFITSCKNNTLINLLPSGSKPRQITLAADKQNEANLGDILRIVVEENRTTQYRWYFDVSGDNILEVDSDEFSLGKKSKISEGGGGTRTITFLTVSSGETTVKLFLMPYPFEEDYDADIIASKTITYPITIK